MLKRLNYLCGTRTDFEARKEPIRRLSTGRDGGKTVSESCSALSHTLYGTPTGQIIKIVRVHTACHVITTGLQGFGTYGAHNLHGSLI